MQEKEKEIEPLININTIFMVMPKAFFDWSVERWIVVHRMGTGSYKP